MIIFLPALTLLLLLLYDGRDHLSYTGGGWRGGVLHHHRGRARPHRGDGSGGPCGNAVPLIPTAPPGPGQAPGAQEPHRPQLGPPAAGAEGHQRPHPADRPAHGGPERAAADDAALPGGAGLRPGAAGPGSGRHPGSPAGPGADAPARTQRPAKVSAAEWD